MKKIFLLMVLVIGLLVGCNVNNNGTAEKNTTETKSNEEVATATEETKPIGAEIKVAVLKGPTGIGAVKLMEDNEQKATTNTYSFTVAGAPDEVTAGIISGEFDVAAVPTNLASVLYNKTQGGIKVGAINTLGVLYVVEDGESIKSISDLEGKDIVASGQGATPEYVLDFILKANNITPNSIEYRAEHAELAAEAASGTVKIAVLPEPNVTSVMLKNPNARIALNLTEEWKKAVKGGEYENSELAMGCIIVRKEFLDSNKEAFDTFLNEYKASIDYTNANNEKASELVEKFGIMPSAKAALKAIPNCNITYIDNDKLKETLNPFLNVLYEANPKSVGGNMPDDEFYYKK